MITAKELVRNFYASDLANDPNIVTNFFHKDCELHWSSSHGFMLLKYNEILSFFEGTRQSYNQLRFDFTHFIEANSSVITRHTLFGNTIEDPDNEVVLAHFSTIWEVKNEKLYRGYEISQQADESNSPSMKSYAKRKI